MEVAYTDDVRIWGRDMKRDTAEDRAKVKKHLKEVEDNIAYRKSWTRDPIKFN